MGHAYNEGANAFITILPRVALNHSVTAQDRIGLARELLLRQRERPHHAEFLADQSFFRVGAPLRILRSILHTSGLKEGAHGFIMEATVLANVEPRGMKTKGLEHAD